MNDTTKARLDDACKALNRAMIASGAYDGAKSSKPKVYPKGKTLLIVRGEKR